MGHRVCVVRVHVFDVSVFAGCVTEETLQRFFTHTLMRVLTYRPLYKGEIDFLHFAFMFFISEE